MRGTVLDGRYTLTERIGAGGMGAVWRARDARLDREVAVKLLGLPTDTSAPERERMLALFAREARAAAALDSSYIVPVFDHGSDGDVPYLVMPLLTGRTVTELLSGGQGLPLKTVVDVAGQVCRALAVAHRAGIVHRDIKPANVMVTDEGTVKVLDFGIAKFLDATTGAGGGYLTTTSDSPIGTLHYMAPERFTRGPSDGRTDVYALGCMLHQMLTGATPFDAPSAAALMHCHVYETPDRPSLRRTGLPPEWDGLVARMLAKSPADRPDAEQARLALESLPLELPAAPAAPRRPVSDTSYPLAPPMPQGPPTSWPPRLADSAPQPAPSAPQPSYAAPHPAPPAPQFGQPLPQAPLAARRPWWRTWWIPGGAAVAIAALVVTLTVVDPFGGDKDPNDKSSSNQGSIDRGSGRQDPVGGTAVAERAKTETLTTGTQRESTGPAPAVKGARRGGTVNVIEPLDLTTVDPARIWSGSDRITSRLIYRSMTGLKTLPDGSVRVVGDLATDPGRPSSGGRTWTFRLKEGLTYNDGTAVRARDFAYAVERTLDPRYPEGDRLLRTWILGTEKMTGANAPRTLPPGTIETPDDRTVVFHLESPHPDFNVALAGPGGVPLPERVKDVTQASRALPSTGPYQVSSFTVGKELRLSRNPRWEADSDPLRTAYPDAYRIEGNVPSSQLKSRIQSAAPGTAVMSFTGTLGAADTTKTPGSELLSAPSPYVQAYMINTKRVKDLAVRKAIVTALPAADVLAASEERGEVHHNLIPPGVRGARPFDLYGAGAKGDPAKARDLLVEADEDDRRITLGYSSVSDQDAKRAEVIRAALNRAGFRVELKKADTTDYYRNAGAGKYDLFRMPVGAGLPVASSFLPDYFNGAFTYPKSSNYSRLKSARVASAMEAADAATSLSAAGELWSAVDRRVMEEAAAVPVYVPIRTYPYSRKLRGLQVDLDGVSPLNVYVAS
ncbi:ABC transporter substrate-binding protein [Streptomyces sp. G45]|uniref:ABC transporter substrate-binding protein n=1 Tax=Streptomyces sp. G45 TaxID=3406627 RepID=UPI003C203CBB